MCMCSGAQSCSSLCNPEDCSLPGSPVHGIFRQEYQRGLPFPIPRGFPNPGIKLMSSVSPALQADSLPAKPQELDPVLLYKMRSPKVGTGANQPGS